jgi:site-specific DNA-methyltransferase (adenine-specific)
MTKQIIFSVKAGHTSVTHIYELRGVIEREKAAIGVLITMEQPTQPMRTEAASAGFYQAPWGKASPRIQLLTVADLLSGKTVDFPRENVTFKKAPKATIPETKNEELPFG